MSLNWDITNVKDFEELQEGEPWSITEAMIFDTIAVGIGRITENNWYEFYARSTVWGKINMKPLRGPDGPLGFTPEDVHRRIGLHTNVSEISRTEFLKKIDKELDQLQGQAERKIRDNSRTTERSG